MRALAVSLAIFVAAFAAGDKAMVGKYVGEWKSGASGRSGTLRFTLEGPKREIWHSGLSLVFDGVEIPAVVREVKVNEAQGTIELTYDFDVQRATRRMHIAGNWDGASFKGKYETTMAGAPADTGTWTAVREKTR